MIIDFLIKIFFALTAFSALQLSIFGVRLFYFIFVGLFLLVFLVWYLSHSRFIKKEHFNEIKIVLIFLALLAFSDLISVIGILQSDENISVTQIFKALIQATWMKIFLALFLIYSAVNRYRSCESYLNSFVFVILISCFYQFTYIFFRVSFDIDLDNIIWPVLTFGSYNTPELSNAIGMADFTFYRHGGFALSPNIHVALLICVLPIVYFYAQNNKRWFYLVLFIFVISMLSTLSRSGLLALFLLLITIPLFCDRKLRHYVVLFFMFPAILFILVFAVDSYSSFGITDRFLYFTFARTPELAFTELPRGQLFLAGVDMWSKHPLFGVGINTSPVLLDEYEISREAGHNLHNYWLQQLVERGVFVFVVVAYYAYLMIKGWQAKNQYGNCLVISLISLSVIGLTNNSLAHSAITFYLIVLYCTSLRKPVIEKDIFR